jgi:hypothetical protein
VLANADNMDPAAGRAALESLRSEITVASRKVPKGSAAETALKTQQAKVDKFLGDDNLWGQGAKDFNQASIDLRTAQEELLATVGGKGGRIDPKALTEALRSAVDESKRLRRCGARCPLSA